MKALHRTFATHVGVSRFDLASEVDAIIVFRKSAHRLLSHNPLTAAFMTTPQAAVGVNTIAGKIAFRHFLETMLADLLQGPSAAIVRAIMTRTVNQPSIPFQRQDEEVGTYMINAIRSTPQWATWRSSCQLHTWFVKQHKPGTHYTPLARLATSNCISKDGISYFATPAQPEQLEIVTRLRSGLMAGLSQHSLDSLRSHIPPQWTQATP